MGTIQDQGAVAGIVIAALFGFAVVGAVAYGVYTGKIPLDIGMAIFIALVTTTNFGLSSSMNSIKDATSKKNAVISVIVLTSITIIALLLYLGLTTYWNFQKTSIQTSYKYIHALIPVSVVISIVSLSATAMKQLTIAGSTNYDAPIPKKPKPICA